VGTTQGRILCINKGRTDQVSCGPLQGKKGENSRRGLTLKELRGISRTRGENEGDLLKGKSVGVLEERRVVYSQEKLRANGQNSRTEIFESSAIREKEKPCKNWGAEAHAEGSLN